MELAEKKRYLEPLVCKYTDRPFCIVLVFTYCPAQLPRALRAAPVRTTLTVLHAHPPACDAGGEGGGGLATAVEPAQSLAREHIFPELYAVFAQQQLPLIMLLQFQPEPLLPAQEEPDKHDASTCTSKRSAVAREERRIGSPATAHRGTPAQHDLGRASLRVCVVANPRPAPTAPTGEGGGRGWVRRARAHAGAAE